MKKNKLLIPIITFSSTAGIITPLTTLSSCGCSSKWNLMKEYTPSIPQKEETSYANQEKALIAYLTDANKKPEIFEQDLFYTLSRGLPQLESYISEHCEVKSFNLGADIDVVRINVSEKTVVCDVTLRVKYDLTGTKVEEMQWYELNYFKINTESKIRLTLDFNTFSNDFSGPYSQRKQMTTFAGATQFGISEIGSTLRVLYEKGEYVNLNNETVSVDKPEDSVERHFILPEKSYWVPTEGQSEDAYWARYNEVHTIWTQYPSVEYIILMIQYYMSNNIWNVPKTPAVLSMGSYYMSNAMLDNLYTTVSHDEFVDIYGLNFSLDSIKNAANLKKQSALIDGTLTMTENIGSKGINKINTGAFSGGKSGYTNLGLPSDVKNLVLPAGKIQGNNNALSISTLAFEKNYWLKSIKFQAPAEQSLASHYPNISKYAFSELYAVNEIDFSDWDKGAAKLITDATTPELKYDGIFVNIHVGAAIPEDGKIGTFYYPNKEGVNKSEWLLFMNRCGLPEWKAGQQVGWELKAK